MTCRGKVPSQALDMPRIWIWRGSAAEQGIEGAEVAAEEAADKGGTAGPGVAEHDGVGVAVGGGAVDVRADADAPATRHKVRIAMGEDDHVAGGKLHLFLADEPGVAAALDEDVVGDKVLCRWKDAGRELARRQGLDAPWINGLDGVEVGPVEAYDAQQVGERVHSKA